MKSNVVSFASICLILSSCGSADSDPGALSSESASEIATSSVSGAVAAASGGESSMASLEPNTHSWASRKLQDFSLFSSAWAINTCPVQGESPKSPFVGVSCNAGLYHYAFNDCNFLKADGINANPASWNGALDVTFFNAGSATCPAQDWNLLGSSGTWTATKSFAAGTTRSRGPVSISINSISPKGWDTTQTLGVTSPATGGATIYGHVIQYTSATTRKLLNGGIEYIATSSYTTKKGVARSGVAWDHTVSYPAGLNLTVTPSTKIKSVYGTVYTQHNLLKFTATHQFGSSTDPIIWDHSNSGCGCFPVSGTIQTTFTGSRAGKSESLHFVAGTSGSYSCGAAEFTGVDGVKSQIVLAHCL